MKVLDVNLLLYAYDSLAPEHERARLWLEEVFSGEEWVGLPWQTIAAFLRILTYPSLKGERYSTPQAIAIVQQWLELPHVRLLSPRDQHWSVLQAMLVRGDARGKLVPDAQLAALTVEHGGVLYTNDRDFARFPSLRWVNPLDGN